MREFYGPYVWSAEQPKPCPLYWPAVGVIAAIPAFWIGVVCLVWLL